MSFLAPFFLLGGLAVALPVVFHLVRRSSKEKMVFSSLMFLRPTPPRMTRRNRLENIFLLLLRCLVIAILSLGFARPFLQKPMAAPPSGNAAARIVLLVDASASMRRDGVWPQALVKADAAFRAAAQADSISILIFDEQTRSVVTFEEWAAMNPSERVSLASQRLSQNKPSWRATHIGNALIAATEALEDADKRQQTAGAKRIVLITDLQEGARLDGLQGYEWPRDIEVVVETIKAQKPTNAGLQWVMDAEDAAPAATDAGPRIRVSNSADAKREQFQLRWEGVAGAPSLDVYVPPGQSRVVAAPKLPAGANGEQIKLTGDDDDFDDSVYIVQPKTEEISALYLGDDSEKDSAQLPYYLTRAFQDTRRQVVHIKTQSPTSPSPTLAANRLVIAASTLPENRISELRQYMTNGGMVLFVMNDAASAKTIGQLIGASDLTATESPVQKYAMFGKMDFEQPLLAPFADPRFSDFTKIRFWKHRSLPLDKITTARVVACFDDNDAAIVEIPEGRGRLFIFTFSWRPADSQFALSSKFVPLLYSLLDQAGGAKAQLAQHRVGEAIELSGIVPKTGNAALTIRKPDGTQMPLKTGETSFSQTDQPGVYELTGSTTPMRFAVNLDAAESRTASLPMEDLDRLGLPMKSREVALAKQAEQKQTLHDADLESRQKLWRWLIVAALGVLLVETWLAGWLTRRAAAHVEATA